LKRDLKVEPERYLKNENKMIIPRAPIFQETEEDGRSSILPKGFAK